MEFLVAGEDGPGIGYPQKVEESPGEGALVVERLVHIDPFN
jgi:hypothetical protein